MTDATDLVEELREHRYVYDVVDVSFNGTPRVNVQFNTLTLPRVFLDSDCYQISDVWVNVVPPWYLRRFAKEWCLKRGVGSSAIAAELEVEP